MSQPEPSNDEVQAIVEHKVRHVAGIQALRKIGSIVAQEQRSDPFQEAGFIQHSKPQQGITSEIIEHKIRDAAAVNALHKIADIVAEERQCEAEKERVLRWLLRYGWILVMAFGVMAKLIGAF